MILLSESNWNSTYCCWVKFSLSSDFQWWTQFCWVERYMHLRKFVKIEWMILVSIAAIFLKNTSCVMFIYTVYQALCILVEKLSAWNRYFQWSTYVSSLRVVNILCLFETMKHLIPVAAKNNFQICDFIEMARSWTIATRSAVQFDLDRFWLCGTVSWFLIFLY